MIRTRLSDPPKPPPPTGHMTKAWVMIRTVFDTIFPTLELSNGQHALIVGSQALFDTANTTQRSRRRIGLSGAFNYNFAHARHAQRSLTHRL